MMRERSQSKIGLISWPTDRSIGFQAPLLETMELTPPPRSDAATAAVSGMIVGAHDGRVRVELVDEQEETFAGYGFDDCEPIVGDQPQAVVHLKGKTSLPESGRFRARLEITRGVLWAFEFTG